MRKWTVFTLLCSVLFITLIGVSAMARPPSQDYDRDTPYEYPVVPGTPEWYAFTTQMQKVHACQIPDDILQNLTTEALVETVLNYPLSSNMYAYDNIQLGYNNLKNQFNGLQELERRKDALTVLSNTYAVTMEIDVSERSLKEYFAEDLFSLYSQK